MNRSGAIDPTMIDLAMSTSAAGQPRRLSVDRSRLDGFNWNSITLVTLRTTPRPETAIMMVTVSVVVFTHNLAYGVGVGVVLSAVVFARHVSDVVR